MASKPYKVKSQEEKQVEIQELTEKMYANMERYMDDPEEVKQYLQFMSSFHHYSVKNQNLIQSQYPGAKAVASFKHFSDMGFRVNKGEKAIKIFVPTPVTFFNRGEERVSLTNATAAEKRAIQQGQLQTYRATYYKLGNVFDINQTNAQEKDLPELFPNKFRALEGTGKEDAVFDILKQIAEERGIDVFLSDDKHPNKPDINLGNAHGMYVQQTWGRENTTYECILLHPKNNKAAMVSTFLHELGHAVLHNQYRLKKQAESGATINYLQPTQELQAEMVAHVVSHHLGIDTSDNSTPYIAYWTKNGAEIQDKIEVLKEVQQASHELIEQIDEKWNSQPELELEQEKQAKKQSLSLEQVLSGDFQLVHEIPEEVGQRYESLTSFKRGKDFNAEVKAYMTNFAEQFKGYVTEENREKVDERLTAYNKLVVDLKTKILQATTIPSVMISGASNYPKQRKERELERIHRIEGELYSDEGKHAKFMENTTRMFDPAMQEQRKELEQKRTATAQEKGWNSFFKEIDHEEIAGYGVDLETNRLYLKTHGKPSQENRTLLKKAALKWSPKNERWQRILTDNAINSVVDHVFQKIDVNVGKTDFRTGGEQKQEANPEKEAQTTPLPQKSDAVYVPDFVQTNPTMGR